jgi:hypothetical protein
LRPRSAARKHQFRACYNVAVSWRCCAVAILLAAAPAHADDTSIHATATGTVATTDNVFATAQNRDGDIYTQVRPGFLFAYDAPRMVHEIVGEVEVLEYLFHSQSPSLTGRGGWTALFLPGPRSDALVSVNGSSGVLNAITSRTSADQSPVGVVPTGAIDIKSADASEQVSYQAGKHVRTSETIYARYLITDDNAGTKVRSGSIGTNLSLERNWQHDTLALIVGGDLLRLERTVPSTAPPGPITGNVLIQQANPRATVQWRHDIDRRWSTTVDLGATLVNPYGMDPYNPGLAPPQAELLPTAGATVGYTDTWGRAMLTVHRVVAPNLLIAQNTIDDAAIAQVALPLPWLNENPAQPKLVALGTFGVERTQLLDSVTSSTVGEFDVVRFDASLGWTPRPGQTWGLRYELIAQHGDMTAAMLVPSFYRNTVLVTFQLRYPERLRTRIPRSGQSVRADRRDVSPLGAEPVIVDDDAPPDRDR